LSQRSMKLFLERFAEPFRERGDDPKLGARTGNRKLSTRVRQIQA
jgi:hypothetical protein